MPSSTTGKKNLKRRLANNKCESCGYKKYPQILTLHHIYPKRNGSQPLLPRPDRYLVLCPNCHALVERGLIDDIKLHEKCRISSKSEGEKHG